MALTQLVCIIQDKRPVSASGMGFNDRFRAQMKDWLEVRSSNAKPAATRVDANRVQATNTTVVVPGSRQGQDGVSDICTLLNIV